MSTTKRVTIKDVAKDAGVSIKTVSNVINESGSMRESTRQRVLDSIQKMGYVVNMSARSLKTGTTGLLGLAIFDFTQPFASDLVDAVIDAARQQGYGVIIDTYGFSGKGLSSIIDDTYRLGADGWIYFADRPFSEKGKELEQSYPVVLTGDYEPFSETDFVTMPNSEAVQAVTTKLLDGGAKKVALLGAPTETVGFDRASLEAITNGTQELRMLGFARAFWSRGERVDWNYVIPSVGMIRKDGVAAAERLLSMGSAFDAVVCMNDAMAFGATYALQRHGLRIPEDVQVVGFDNVSEGEYSTPALSTIDPYIHDYARAAVRMLIERIDGYHGAARRYVTDYSIVERESSHFS